MECKCGINLIQSLGLPSCGPIPEKIVKIFFTRDLRPMSFHANDENYPTLPPEFNYEIPWYYIPGVNNTSYDLWFDLYSLVTPIIDNVDSEKPDAVREEIGGNSYFVKYSPRTFTLTLAKKQVEFGRLIALLRCETSLGMFLLDSNGILWGMRGNNDLINSSNNNIAEVVAPIPINPATIEEKLMFPTDSAISKWVITFQLMQTVHDYDFVPVYYDKRLISYNPPMSLFSKVKKESENIYVGIFARFAVGEKETLFNVTNLATYPTAFDENGPILNDTTQWTLNGNIYLLTDIPTGTLYYRYTPLQLRSITHNAYDYPKFIINL